MKEIKLRLKNKNNTIMEFNGVIINSYDDEYKIGFIANDDLKNIQYDTRFIIGELYPRAYKVVGINEYDTILLNGKNVVAYRMQLDQLCYKDDVKQKIAFNYYGE
jgi:hypothetical protein